MGCGCGKVAQGVVDGDPFKVAEGLYEGGEVMFEFLGDFWSGVGEASLGDAQHAAARVGEAVAGGAGDALEVAGMAAGGLGAALQNIDPAIIVMSMDLLLAMEGERISSCLEQSLGEKYLTPIDLSDEPDLEADPGPDGRSILEKACKPLGLESAARDSRCAAAELNKGTLTLDEAGAVYLYTGNTLYRRLNEDLRDRDRRKSRPYFAYLRLFCRSFDKLVEEQAAAKACQTDLFRGCRGNLVREYPEGATVVWWAVSSTTPDINVAKSFAGAGGTIFRIKARRAVKIQHLSAVASEKEFLLSPGTRLRVMAAGKNAEGFLEVLLVELPGESLVSVVVKKSIPEVWKNAKASGHFDQVIEIVPAQVTAGVEKRKLFQDILDLSWKGVPTQDRPCPRGICEKRGGGCACLEHDGNPGMPKGLKVHRVLRFEDSKMWSRYISRLVEVQQNRGGSVKPLERPLKQAKAWNQFMKDQPGLSREVSRGLAFGAFAPLEEDLNEVYLFHGTGAAAATAICEDGFLLSKAGSNVGTMYGAGVYLTDSCTKSDEYAKADEHGVFRLLMCRTCLGKPFVTESRDQNAGDNFMTGVADCTLGDREKAVGTYREFVLYDSAQIYPEFIVEYTRRGPFYEAQVTKTAGAAAGKAGANAPKASHTSSHGSNLVPVISRPRTSLRDSAKAGREHAMQAHLRAARPVPDHPHSLPGATVQEGLM